MAKNTGKPYELLTQTIFNEIVNQNSVQTIEVKQNVILQGKILKHQIDVYWEFKCGNIIYYTIIQARDWASTVKQEHLMTFKQVLDDLPNQPRGIFVTKTGYQKGSLDFAKANGIELFELREFTAEDAKGRLKTVVLNITAYTPHSEVVGIEEDKIWVSNYMKDHDLKDPFGVSIIGDSQNIFLIDEKGNNIESFKTIVDKLYPEDFKELPETQKVINFTIPAFIKTTNELMPILKLNKLIVNISVGKIEVQQRMEFDDIIAFILKNVITNEEKLIKEDLKLLE
jgi:hypothetical protein